MKLISLIFAQTRCVYIQEDLNFCWNNAPIFLLLFIRLPVPWLVASSIDKFRPVSVVSEGLFCSTILLFLMLLAVIITIAANKWRMTRVLGGTMFALYALFITITLLIQFKVMSCPMWDNWLEKYILLDTSLLLYFRFHSRQRETYMSLYKRSFFWTSNFP